MVQYGYNVTERGSTSVQCTQSTFHSPSKHAVSCGLQERGSCKRSEPGPPPLGATQLQAVACKLLLARSAHAPFPVGKASGSTGHCMLTA